ncbi:variable surface lipoprotein [Mycoplasma sp. CSL7503-lung]|uniref:variable surface lipoprotein n=1 Tax=Mycoplasma sp. CSL7503-lung TaxID=536372 RepID=UPI0021CE6F74|nr:variable surface lipoprotein [Mycoplasma sp. CSL7503-lung]MCU4706912.1 variable surface lipoprotein [Mycoplasma sp. CSL7503-lung]
MTKIKTKIQKERDNIMSKIKHFLLGLVALSTTPFIAISCNKNEHKNNNIEKSNSSEEKANPILEKREEKAVQQKSAWRKFKEEYS